MTKATLKNVASQYILIVDERPKLWDWFLDIDSKYKYQPMQCLNYNDWVSWWRIIAAENLDGVKGIRFKDKEYILSNIPKHIRFKDDETTWKEYLEQYIDTEVEVTEEEDYYLIRL